VTLGWGAPQNFEVPYNISATAEVSNFKIGMLLGFAMAHHKIPHRRKRGRDPACAIGAPQNYWVPSNICATAEASNFKFGMLLGLAKAHHKNYNKRKKLPWPSLD